MKRVQVVNGLEYSLEALTESVIEVVHRDQTGWFGVNLDAETDDDPFAWALDAGAKTEAGISGGDPVPTPEQALDDLAAMLASIQEQRDAEEARDPRNRLGALMQTLPTEETSKGGWRRFGSAGADFARRGRKAIQEKASQTGDNIKGGTGSLLEKASQKATQGKEKLQGGVAKANLSERRKSLAGVFSPSKQCESDGHLFDEIRLISTKGTLSRMCRRCHQVIKVNLDEEAEGATKATDGADATEVPPAEIPSETGAPGEEPSSNGIEPTQEGETEPVRTRIGMPRRRPDGE